MGYIRNLRNATVPRQAHAKRTGGHGFILLHHLGCGLLVVVFVHFYGLYQLVNHQLGGGFLAVSPFVLPVLLLAALIFRRYQVVDNLSSIHRLPVILGLCCCLGALALPDPEIAVKRIHVMEYLLLSLYVRYTLSRRIGGKPLLVFSCMLSCLYGVHDELLQGIHPARTYGLLDMLVNGVAAIGGGLVWHGLNLFCRHADEREAGSAGWPWPHILYLLGLAAAVPAMAVPLIVQRHDVLPGWSFLPLAAAMVVWVCYFAGDRSTLRHGVMPVSVVAFLFLVYPLAVNGLQIAFY